ncbi:hypothetical protein [Laspinema olomoucense]|uniref:Uncharacterized protein n=1 Tax=Laspinema olomoucense D3b TaxID=2953688 RepID=A0ABT2ND70_9CYAN|nr:hypothetical protein [Laspinema sp. D3b]MCT7979710.1 hypothetical protein [Laspinema sp. D3b]
MRIAEKIEAEETIQGLYQVRDGSLKAWEAPAGLFLAVKNYCNFTLVIASNSQGCFNEGTRLKPLGLCQNKTGDRLMEHP